jgi:flagellar motor switch protein FliN/FliY
MTVQDWIQNVCLAVEEASEVPLFGHPPTFLVEPFLEALKEALELNDLSLEISNQDFIENGSLLHSLGGNPSVLSFALEPLSSHVYLAMSQEDAGLFAMWTLSSAERAFAFQDDHLQKGYFLYAMAEVVRCLKKSGNYSDLHIRLGNEDLTQERSFCATIRLSSLNESIFARLIIPQKTQSAIKKHYLSKLPNFYELKSRSGMMIETSLTAGSATLTSIEMHKLQVGDFLILDDCTYHPLTKKGYVQLNVGRFPLVQLKVKESELKVLDYAYKIEGEPIMQEEDNDFPQEASSLDDILEDETPVVDGFELSNDQPVEKIVQSTDSELFHPSAIPLTLSVEVARLSISLEKLLELQPGNILSTHLCVESGVKLCLAGRPIAKGELMNLGDMLGVKITEIQNQK